MLNIIIAEDHVLMRKALEKIISLEYPKAQIKLASQYQEIVEVLNSVIDAKNNLLILDLRMPGIKGHAQVEALVKHQANVKVIVYTGLEALETKKALLQIGVARVVSKTGETQELLSTIQEILKTFEVTNSLTDSHSNSTSLMISNEIFSTRRSDLTERHLDILRYLHQGFPNKLIARELGLAIGTVKNHLYALYERLGVKSRSEAISKTREWFL